MARPKLADVDLNLLVALDALLAEGSVTKAARRLGLGQPAMSGALARLRTLFGDPLLVRTRQGMSLTVVAGELREPLADVLARIEQTLSRGAPFDASTSERRFVLCATDYLEFILLPRLLERLRESAPRVGVEVRSVGEKRVGEELAAGVVDVAVGQFKDSTAGIYRQALFQERLVCMVRAGHPAGLRPLRLETYAALDHLVVAPRGGGKTHVDRLLAEHGLDRRVAHRTPHFLVAPAVVARTDLAVTLAERLARAFAVLLPLQVLELPFETAPAALSQFWHERTHLDAGHRWFRKAVADVAAAL